MRCLFAWRGGVAVDCEQEEDSLAIDFEEDDIQVGTALGNSIAPPARVRQRRGTVCSSWFLAVLVVYARLLAP